MRTLTRPRPPAGRSPLSFAAAFLALASAVGCARYEYDVIRPPDLGQRVGHDRAVVVPMDFLEYRLNAVEGRLVMRVYNRSDEPVRLLGEESVAVDPRGESHSLRGRTIAPGSFIKLILPPPRPRVERVGPSFGVGVGMSRADYYRRYGYGGGYGPPFDDEPRYYTVYDEGDATYWTWKGETEARLVLVFQRGEERISHEFVFRRRRV